MKELKHDTAGNTPEPTLRALAGEVITALRIQFPFTCAGDYQQRFNDAIDAILPTLEIARNLGIASRAAAPSQEAAPPKSAEALAQQFHETYERLAPLVGYATRRESAKPWAEVPETNRILMIAVCREILGSMCLGSMFAEPAPSPATKDTHFLDFDQIAIELARELYDRFVMGGWGPEDVYSEIVRRLQVWHEAAPKDTRELIWLVELFHNGKSEGWWVGPPKSEGGWRTDNAWAAKRYTEAEAKAVAAALDYFPAPFRWSHWVATEHVFTGKSDAFLEETLEKIITDILKLHGHPVTHNSKALARELFDAGAQSRTATAGVGLLAEERLLAAIFGETDLVTRLGVIKQSIEDVLSSLRAASVPAASSLKRAQAYDHGKARNGE